MSWSKPKRCGILTSFGDLAAIEEFFDLQGEGKLEYSTEKERTAHKPRYLNADVGQLLHLLQRPYPLRVG